MPPISLRNFQNIEALSPVKLSYYLLLICGLMNQEGRPWTLIIVNYHGITLTLVGILSAAKVYVEMDDLNEFIQPLIICIVLIHVIGKFINILLNQTKIHSLLDRLEHLRQQELEDSIYASQFTKADKLNKALIYYVYLNVLSVPVVSAVFNIITDYLSDAEKPSLILPMWLPWNYDKSWSYVATVLASTLISFTTAVLFCTLYTLLFTITFQLSALLKILQAKMEANKANDKSIFRQHINILQLLQQFNELFSGQYYLEILISSIQPCGFCYMLMKNLKSGDSRWPDLLFKFLLTLIIPLWLCACGEEINSQVAKLHASSYRGSWYEEQPAARKDLLILMTVTSRPLKFGYKGLITFNLLCFATVIQAFYSYVTMLSNFEMSD